MKYTKATARTLYLTGSSYEIGYRLGDVISKDTVWRRKCVSHNNKMNQNRLEKINSLLDIWCPGLCDELKGIADALHVESKDLYFYHMTHLVPNCSQIAVCSSITKEKKPLLARNFEFSDEIEDFTLIKTSVTGKHTHMGTSILGAGRDDGINEYGLAVTMTSCGIPVVDLPYMKTPCIEGLQYWIVVRALLENCRNVQEALSYIKDMPIAFHMNMIIFDKEEHAALIQTYAGKKAIRCITTEEALLFTTNHAVLDDDKHLESGAFKHSVQRYQYIEEKLSNKTDITRNTLKEMLLSDYPEGLCFHHYRESFGTTKSMILSPFDNTIELCWGGLARNTWRCYSLDDIQEEQRDIALAVETDKKDILEWIPL